jgi:preprotein translocase subunit SecB
MAEDNTPAEAPAEPQSSSPGIRILAQYIKDLSFENPRAPESLRGAEPPKIELDVELGARGRPDGFNEVDLKLSVTANRAGEVVFHCEILMGGLFQIEGVPPEELEGVLLVECPRFLFPFARRIVADLTVEGGFPPFRMDPIDFMGIYMARQQQQAQQADGGVQQA